MTAPTHLEDHDDLADAPLAPRVAGIGPLARLQLAEPVRLWLYPVLVALLGLAVTYGLISDTVAPQWEALAAAVLAIGGHGVIRAVRGAVVSPRTHIRELVALERGELP